MREMSACRHKIW